ncbi:FtsX-like permease family protein [Streptomyces sp. NPDC002994]|uniref:ABC transporter permease n=1 Tax=Streptomyces sp. NPDC002994 TaxID=3154441 RepID=UPI0033AB0B49
MSWSGDLRMGARFAVAGGREGWLRTALTAVGVGLGVALLLFSTAVPSALSARDQRDNARNDYGAVINGPAADDTMLLGRTDTVFRDKDIRGRLLKPEGSSPSVPPGVERLPGSGEMVVSPKLRELLSSPEGELLRQRLDATVVGTIADAGLVGPHDLAYYAGDGTLEFARGDVMRIRDFVAKAPTEKMDPVLALLVVIIFVVLLLPVAIFIAAAVRFGSDRRDRRLAALRLVGADGRTTRRIAAGEALAGSLAGLVLGAGFFLLGRQFVGEVTVAGLNLFPADVDPSPLLAVLIAVSVPAAAVGVTLFALRGVVIEPLGVVRTATPRKRRMWWRLLPPAVGLALLYPMLGKGRDDGAFNQAQVIGGTVLLLIGVTALLPWIVEAVVARIGGGTPAWQLAVRRLQMSSGNAARLVNGIAIAVAGAIALQMLFAGIEGDYRQDTGADPNRAQLSFRTSNSADPAQNAALTRQLRTTQGVRDVISVGRTGLATVANEPQDYVDLTIGDCRSLRELAKISDCRDGSVFLTTGGWDHRVLKVAKPGRKLFIDPTFQGEEKGSETPWTLPAKLPQVPKRDEPTGGAIAGVLATPGALPPTDKLPLGHTAYLKLDSRVPDAAEHARNTVATADPLIAVRAAQTTKESTRFAGVRKGLYIGAAAVLMLIGASLLVSMLEQLRDRKRLLSSLVAFGTRRTTLSWSVLWQAAVPVVLGLALATVVGLALGAVLLKMVARRVSVDWFSVVAMSGIGAGVVLLVTALSLPPLWRLMRPDGLRTE